GPRSDLKWFWPCGLIGRWFEFLAQAFQVAAKRKHLFLQFLHTAFQRSRLAESYRAQFRIGRILIVRNRRARPPLDILAERRSADCHATEADEQYKELACFRGVTPFLRIELELGI